MNKILSIFGSKPFIISFAASLCVVAVLFIVFAFASEAQNGTVQNTSAETRNAGRGLWSPGQSEEDDDEEEEEICEIPEGTELSVLTGLRIYEEDALRRPLAVVINNIRASHPQAGIASADIVYEALAEGDVTRFVAVFQSYVPEKIGSVRSARDYFVDFAWNHDAIFVFHGSSPGGINRMNNTRINRIDPDRGGQAFWRDRTFPYWSATPNGTRSVEHSSYTSRARIDTHIYENEFRAEIGADPAFGFRFGEVADFPRGVRRVSAVSRIEVPFSRPYTRIFVYCEDENIFRVENPNGPQIDELTREGATVSNVLIQFVPMSVIDGMGRRNISTVGEGSGYLITAGERFGVLWHKESHTSPMRWTFENGEPIILTPGRTWICVVHPTMDITFE